MIDVSVSALQRATACHASVVLPRGPDTRGAAAVRGDLIHASIAAELRGWPMPDVGRHRIKYDLAALQEYIWRAGKGDLMCELAMAYDGESVTLVGENVGRGAYPEGKLCGSADLVVLREHALVVDHKTGTLPVPHPRENWQIATLAMMVARLFAGSVKTVTGVIAKLDREGAWDFAEHTFTLEQLQSVQDKIDAARASWSTAEALHESGWGVTPTPGPHCRFCRCLCEHAEARVYPAAEIASAV